MVFRKRQAPPSEPEIVAQKRAWWQAHYRHCPMRPDLKPGDRFGRLTVFEVYESWNGRFRVKAECACGAVVDQRPGYLLRGVVKSCGCLRSERARSARAEGALARRRRYETA